MHLTALPNLPKCGTQEDGDFHIAFPFFTVYSFKLCVPVLLFLLVTALRNSGRIGALQAGAILTPLPAVEIFVHAAGQHCLDAPFACIVVIGAGFPVAFQLLLRSRLGLLTARAESTIAGLLAALFGTFPLLAAAQGVRRFPLILLAALLLFSFLAVAAAVDAAREHARTGEHEPLLSPRASLLLEIGGLHIAMWFVMGAAVVTCRGFTRHAAWLLFSALVVDTVVEAAYEKDAIADAVDEEADPRWHL